MDLNEFLTFVTLRGTAVIRRQRNDKNMNPVLKGTIYQIILSNTDNSTIAYILYKQFGEWQTIIQCSLRWVDNGKLLYNIDNATFDQVVELFINGNTPKTM